MFGFRGERSMLTYVCYDWFSVSMRRRMSLDPLSLALTDRRGGPELDKLSPTDLLTDLELFLLVIENHFKVEKTKQCLTNLSTLIGEFAPDMQHALSL